MSIKLPAGPSILGHVLRQLDAAMRERGDARFTLEPEDQADMRLRFIHGSEALSGNQLDPQGMAMALKGGMVMGARPVDVAAARRHALALALVEGSARPDNAGANVAPLTQALVCGIHSLLMGDTAAAAGRSGIDALLSGYAEDERPSEHPVLRAAMLHNRFWHLHPFTDGNERTARLLAARELLAVGYPLPILRRKDHTVYSEALATAALDINGGVDEHHPLAILFAQALLREATTY